MSQEHVELARRYIEAFNSGGLEGSAQWRHPDVELHDPPELPDAGRYVGEAAVRARVQEVIDMGWEGRFRNPEYIDADAEVVVAWEFRVISAHGGGFPLDIPQVHVLLFEDGKVRRVRMYMSRQEALEAAGLRS
ncbi:MAG TPA: nuclear transport factor 2 family protein [Solirubrobacterales bacterium]|nr:nuclear transport factor 2 family protein [Solirubrobacterales bacterium]